MKGLINFFLERSLIVNILTLAILLLGSLYAYNLQKEIFPRVDFGVVTVTAIYPGSSAEDVERRVLIPMEREIKGISGIDEMNSLSNEGVGRIIITVEQRADLDTVVDDIKNAIDRVKDFPDSVESPTVNSQTNKDQQVISVILKGNDYNLIKETAKDLRDDLELMNEIRRVTLNGYLPDEIRLTVNPEKLAFYEVTAKDIVKAVQERNRSIPAGKMETSQGSLFIRVNAEFQILDDVKNVVIRSNSSGKNVKISDVAMVTREPDENGVRFRSNAQTAVLLDVIIKDNADIIKSTQNIKESVQQFFKKNPHLKGQITYDYTNEAASWVKRRLSVLIDNGIMGFILVFICLLLFLNTRTAIITCLGAPIAFMMAFIGMSMAGITLNMISMFSLILVLGMLVDDSIIVAEYYFQKLEKGLSPKEAARQAAIDTIKPVSITIFTSMIAFASFFFMTGVMGKFIWSIPAVVLICLAASLLECYFILPSHLSDFVKLTDNRHTSPWYSSMLNFYKETLKIALKYYWVVLIFFTFLFITAVGFMFNMKWELFPGDDVRVVYMQIKGKLGNPIERTNEIVSRMEKIALQELLPEEIEQVGAQIGNLVERRRTKTAPHYGSLILHLTSPQDRKRSTNKIIKDLSEKMKPVLEEYILTSRKMKGGPPSGKPVDIEISGDKLDELYNVSQKIERELAKIKGILTTEIDFEKGKRQLAIHIKEEEARRLGLSTQEIALELRRLYSNESFDIQREQDEDIDIKIFLDKKSRNSMKTLDNLYIVNKQNRRIPLSRLVETREEPIAFVIRRKNAKRVISVTAENDSDIVTPVEVIQKMTPTVEKILQEHPGVKSYFGGENKDTKDSMQSLVRALIMAACCIFIVLVGLFGTIRHTIVVMSAIPMGLIGVVFTFKVAGQPLSFMSMLGIVALVGVVINDSIVLVNFINKIREEGENNLYAAVLKGGVSRYRAIVLTTITTAAGLLFLAHPSLAKIVSFGLNKDSDPFLQPMAMSFAWGLIFASTITLLFVPALYIFLEKMTNLIKHLLYRVRS